MSNLPWLEQLRRELTAPDLTATQLDFRARTYFGARQHVAEADRRRHDREALWTIGIVRYLRLRRIFKTYARTYRSQGLI